MKALDWNRYGRPRVALFGRVMSTVLMGMTAVLWALFLPVAVMRDWTVVFVPLLVTGGAVMQRVALRKVYRAAPDYSAIARMEREIWGEPFTQTGGPVGAPAPGPRDRPVITPISLGEVRGAGGMSVMVGTRTGHVRYGLPPADASNRRIDAVFMGAGGPVVVYGTPSRSPVAPVSPVLASPLAHIRIDPGMTQVAPANIIPVRG